MFPVEFRRNGEWIEGIGSEPLAHTNKQLLTRAIPLILIIDYMSGNYFLGIKTVSQGTDCYPLYSHKPSHQWDYLRE